ncbi:MAG: DUF5069 domain-containing protein [Candidatus Didemnitutus sp.]|nr:DUF5069 domain-containing protein [Candidatus Didemnitutus sp.]
MIRLRRPTDSLGGCLWLPRFIDKCRLHFAGALPPDYQLPFCHPRATDGAFLAHFGLTKEEALAAIARAENDDDVVAALVARGALTTEKIAAWNTLAPNLGRPGFPCEKSFAWARQHYFPTCTDPRVDSVFTAIAWDEGFLDEIAPPTPPSFAQ